MQKMHIVLIDEIGFALFKSPLIMYSFGVFFNHSMFKSYYYKISSLGNIYTKVDFVNKYVVNLCYVSRIF